MVGLLTKALKWCRYEQAALVIGNVYVVSINMVSGNIWILWVAASTLGGMLKTILRLLPQLACLISRVYVEESL